jgi:predicted alpha/beta-fold hydrolase
VALAGFSLGGNLALLMSGRRRGALPQALSSVVAASPPVDLSRCADALERAENRFYQHYFVGRLRRAYRKRQRSRPDLFPAGLERGSRTIREFDDRVTAPFSGYRGAADYYERSSAGPWLAAIDRPTLVLTAADDPMIPVESIRCWPLAPTVRREITPTGGHLGFVGRSRAPGWFWAAERMLQFAEEQLQQRP